MRLPEYSFARGRKETAALFLRLEGVTPDRERKKAVEWGKWKKVVLYEAAFKNTLQGVLQGREINNKKV